MNNITTQIENFIEKLEQNKMNKNDIKYPWQTLDNNTRMAQFYATQNADQTKTRHQLLRNKTTWNHKMGRQSAQTHPFQDKDVYQGHPGLHKQDQKTKRPAINCLNIHRQLKLDVYKHRHLGRDSMNRQIHQNKIQTHQCETNQDSTRDCHA